MKPLSTSTYTFPDLIEGGYLYVDKTAGILKLLAGTKGYYFLSRPRRFGKSLLVSTLRSIFEGRRELFAGLDIEKSDYGWLVHPVIHLDLGDRAASSAEDLEASLRECVTQSAVAAGIELEANSAASQFRELIQKLAARDGKVVVLVDEYDKPLLGQLGKPEVREILASLKAFYSVIKVADPWLRFVLVTGVSKFSRVSIFSDLNNLEDLTMQEKSATLLGYTQGELERNFPDYIEALAGKQGWSLERTLGELKEWYNGYRFSEDAETVYNPVSVMSCLQQGRFKNYWFETGTPTFLIELLKAQPLRLDNLEALETSFSVYDPDLVNPLPLLMQTGYMTIKGLQVTGRRRTYRLGFPNFEIEESFSMWLAEGFSRTSQMELGGALVRMLGSLEEGDVGSMLEDMKLFFAKVPYTIALEEEKYWQTIFFTVFTLIGTSIEAEVATNIGRIDAVVITRSVVYVFEFKLRGSARDAMEQMKGKRYGEKYLGEEKSVMLVGVAFSREERNIGEYLVERLG